MGLSLVVFKSAPYVISCVCGMREHDRELDLILVSCESILRGMRCTQDLQYDWDVSKTVCVLAELSELTIRH